MGAPTWWSRDLAVGDAGRDVMVVQRKLGVATTGVFDGSLSLTVRGLQSVAGLPTTGVVDAVTAAELGEMAGFGLLPPWWSGEPITESDAVFEYAVSLIGGGGVDALRRWQGNHRLPPTGLVDETTARLLAGLEVE